MIEYCRAYLISLPFIPTSVRINLGSSPPVNPFEGFNWAMFDLMIDSGNADGQHLLDILSISERMNICIYDNPKAIKAAKMFWQSQKSSSNSPITADSTIFRISFEEGEILRSLPTASSHKNLYCFVNVFSGLNDSECLTILTNTKEAIGPFTVTVAVIDSVWSKTLSRPRAVIRDRQLSLEKNIRQRTYTQWKSLINKSDFTITEIVELRSSNKVLVLKLL